MESKQPNRGRRLWLGIFPTTIEAALKYDEVARAMYGPFARLNLLDYKMESCNNSATANTTIASATTSCLDFIITTSNHSKVCFPDDIWKKIENHTGKQQHGKHETKYDRIAATIEASTPVSPSKKPRVEMTNVVELNDGRAPKDEDYFLNFSLDVNELIDTGPVCELGCEEVGVPLSRQGDNLPHM
ncbi:hypothetical protein Ancab_026925 [Ancistrocladus abbreviatus]